MRLASAALDHLVLATADLDATARWVSDTTGITPSTGGQHLGWGTRNKLCSLDRTSYLEIVAPDPEQPHPEGPYPFGLDDVTAPAIVAWAVGVNDIDAAIESARAAGYDPGPAEAMQRQRPDGRTVSWRLTRSPSIIVPFLIDWGDSIHPATDSAPGLVLADLRARHPQPGPMSETMDALGIAIGIARGPEALLVTLRGPMGSLTFD